MKTIYEHLINNKITKVSHNAAKIKEIEDEIEQYEEKIKQLKQRLSQLQNAVATNDITDKDIPCVYKDTEITTRSKSHEEFDKMTRFGHRNETAIMDQVLELIDDINNSKILSTIEFWYSGYCGFTIYNINSEELTIFILEDNSLSKNSSSKTNYAELLKYIKDKL